jgi:glycosyltransferase involved in cell wall biosynthesis
VDAAATKQMAARLEAQLDQCKPDVILTYGYTNYEKVLRKIATARGIPLAFYLAHPGFKDPATFEDIDELLTDSKATQDLYVDRMDLASTVIGKFIERPNARKPTAKTKQITFVNPSYQKGVTLFYRIAEIMNQTLPTARFFVVESRMSLADVEEKSGLPFSGLRNIRSIGLQTDMADVYSRTSILLMPSVWHESGGRTAIEALSLGIPIVSSNHGGLPEHLGAGATRIDVPEQLRANPNLIPPASVALSWVSSLAKLWTDDDHWQQKSNDALEKWKDHEPSARLQLIESRLNAVIG